MADDSEGKDKKRDYEVGYGKPPKRTQFKPGQSGNPISRHYRDFAQRWAAVEHIEIPTTPEAVARIAVGTWTLTPRADK